MLEAFDTATKLLSVDKSPSLHLAIATKLQLQKHLAVKAGESALISTLKVRLGKTLEDYLADLFNSTQSAIRDEVDSYLASSDTSDNVLEFWQQKSKVWPRLSACARSVLAIPAMSTSSERTFSLPGATITKRRTQLNTDTVDRLLFLHGL